MRAGPFGELPTLLAIRASMCSTRVGDYVACTAELGAEPAEKVD